MRPLTRLFELIRFGRVLLLILPLCLGGCSTLTPRENEFREDSDSVADQFRRPRQGLSAGLSDKARQIERNVGVR